jgi:hypothetical protein
MNFDRELWGRGKPKDRRARDREANRELHGSGYG